jgi:hypothetical protein
MNDIEEKAWKVVLAWKSKKFLKEHIDELEKALLYSAKEKKVKQ